MLADVDKPIKGVDFLDWTSKSLKTLSFLILFLPSLYILLSSLSLPNLANAEPTNNNNDSTYLTVSLSNKDANTIAKLDKYITNDNTIITNYPTILNIEANSSVGYLATVSTNKDHSNLTRERTNPNDQANQVINPVQANYSEQEIAYIKDNNGSRSIVQQGGSSLTNNTWGFLPVSKCDGESFGSSSSALGFAPCGELPSDAQAFQSARFYKVPTKDNPVTLKDAAAELGKTKSQTFYIYYGAKLSNSLPAGTYSTNVVYTVTPKLPPIAPPTISKVINDTHYTTKSDLTAIEGTNLKTATSVFIDFNKDGKADSNELATNLKTYPGTAKEDTVISFNTPVTDTPGEYDVYVTTNGGIAKLDQSYIVSKFTLCRSGDTNNSCIVDLDETMIPVKYTGNTNAPKWESLTNDQAGINSNLSDHGSGEWYDYNNKNWANAVTVKDPNKYKNQNKVVDENDVLGYFVYIPRYSYEVMRPNATDKFVPDSDYTLPDNNLIKHPGFMINFENKYNLFKTPGDSTSCSSISGSTLTTKDYRTKCAKDLGYSRLNPENDSTKTNKTTWATHPAFRWQYTKAINGIDRNHELNGFWVGKYETTGSTTAPTVKPNSKHIGFMKNGLSAYYDVAKSLGRRDNYNTGGDNTSIKQNNHNLSYYSSHMLKNTEWGAITYLSASTYGAGLNNVKINGSNNKGKDGNGRDSLSITGCGPKSATNEGEYSGCNAYNTKLGQLASTTNNTTGIYDMVGGAWDYIMANLSDNPAQTTAGKYIKTAVPIKLPYVDLYKDSKAGGKFGVKQAWSTGGPKGYEYIYNNDVCTWVSCGGQALHETKRTQIIEGDYSSWGSDSSAFPDHDFHWSRRGGIFNGGSSVGLFYSGSGSGYSYDSYAFRSVISANLFY